MKNCFAKKTNKDFRMKTEKDSEMKTELFCNQLACKNRWYDKNGYQRCSHEDNMTALFYFRCPYTTMIETNMELPRIERRYGKR